LKAGPLSRRPGCSFSEGLLVPFEDFSEVEELAACTKCERGVTALRGFRVEGTRSHALVTPEQSVPHLAGVLTRYFTFVFCRQIAEALAGIKPFF
jgi:hypothetical protein